MATEVERQREITRLALDALSGEDFALAGFGALREHGISDRLSRDIDLFTAQVDKAAFAKSLDRAIEALRSQGFAVDTRRKAEQFARLEVTTADGYQIEVDLAVDWRATQTATLDVGPVLSLEDAVASKVVALYSRAEARDFLDVDAIRQSKRFTDAQLLEIALNRDPGFDTALFAQQ